MTVTVTPLYPPLSAALWYASVAVYARGGCQLAAFALAWRMQGLGRVYGWHAVASGLTSATAFSAGWWEAGMLFGLMGAGCGVLWRRERGARLNAESAGLNAE